VVTNAEELVGFQSTNGFHLAPLFELAKQVFEIQNFIYESAKFRADNSELIDIHNTREKLLLNQNKRTMRLYSQMRKQLRQR